jgi:hypothetical protein
MGLLLFPVNELRDDKPTRSHVRGMTLDKVGAVPLKVSIRFFWTTRSNATSAGGWMYDINDGDGTPLVEGLGLVLGTDMFKGYRYKAGIPDGQLFAFDTTLSGVEPSLLDFTEARVQLFYRPADEVV